MKDYIIRAMSSDGDIRAIAGTTKNLVEIARNFHNLSHVATVALGRTLTANALMCCFLKNENDTLTIQIKGDGPLGGIVTVGDVHSDVRGYVFNPETVASWVIDGNLHVGAAVGFDGYMNIIKDIGMKEPYIGFVRLVSGEIAEDLAYYFASSEQVPSIVALGVLIEPDGLVSHSGGYIIQLMPGAKESTVSYLEERLSSLESVTEMLIKGNTPEEMIKKVFGDFEMSVLEKRPCSYKCNCSREKMERNLLTLGPLEISNMISETGEAELQCHFCNTAYMFGTQDLNNILKIARN